MVKKHKILLFGFGRYAEQIAKNLALDAHHVLIASFNKEELKIAAKDGFKDLYIVDIEDDAQLTDLILDHDITHVFCAFDDEEKNIYLTITFKSLFRTLPVIAICESKETERKLKLAGADKVIDTMVAAANRLYYIVEKPAVAEAIDEILFKDKSIIFEEIKVPRGSFLDGKNIKDIAFSKKYKIIVIGLVDKELGNKFIFITRGINHKIDAGDVLVVVGKKEDIKNFKKLLGVTV